MLANITAPLCTKLVGICAFDMTVLLRCQYTLTVLEILCLFLNLSIDFLSLPEDIPQNGKNYNLFTKKSKHYENFEPKKAYTLSNFAIRRDVICGRLCVSLRVTLKCTFCSDSIYHTHVSW